MNGDILQIVLNGLLSGSTYAMLTLGFFITYRSARFFDLSYAAVLSFAAYAAYTLIHTLNAPIVIGVILGAVAGGTFAAATELAAYRFLRRQGAAPLVRLLASLGVMIITFNLLSILFGDAAVLTVTAPPNPIIFGVVRFTSVRLVALALAVILFPLGLWLMRRSRWGLQQRAIFDDLELAKGVGINEEAIALMGASLGAGIGGLAAALVAVEGSIKPALGFDLALPALLAMTAGGLRRLEGPIFCALALGILEQVFGWFVGVAWQEVLVASLFVLVLLTSPRRLTMEPQSQRSL